SQARFQSIDAFDNAGGAIPVAARECQRLARVLAWQLRKAVQLECADRVWGAFDGRDRNDRGAVLYLRPGDGDVGRQVPVAAVAILEQPLHRSRIEPRSQRVLRVDKGQALFRML